MIIDSHQHFWQLGRFPYPWMTEDLDVLYRDHLPAELAPTLRRNKVAATVLVQASNSLSESRWLLKLAEENEFIAGVVGWVDLMSDVCDEQLAELSSDPKFKGVRHLVESEPADNWLVQPAVLRGLKRVAAHDLTFDLLVHTQHLTYLPEVIESCPGLSLVVDHLAKPPIATGEINDWAKQLRTVARYPELYCKLSGLVTEANHRSWTTDQLRPYVECALEFFGPDRLMFGSDHPVCLLAASYERVLESFQELVAHLSAADSAKIFSGNASRFYRLNKSV
jgi:L-fuconolactonase